MGDPFDDPDGLADPTGCAGALVALVLSAVLFWAPLAYLLLR